MTVLCFYSTATTVTTKLFVIQTKEEKKNKTKFEDVFNACQGSQFTTWSY